jgi:hypothetical protein
MAGFTIKGFKKGDAHARIEAVVLKKFMKSDATEYADEKRRQVLALERAAINATVDGISALVSKKNYGLSGGPQHLALMRPLQLFNAGKAQAASLHPILGAVSSSVPAEIGVSFETKAWKPLSARYAAKRPPSTTFWRKTGVGADAFNEDILPEMKRLISKRMKATGKITKTTSRSITTQISVELPNFPDQWGFVRDCFLARKALPMEYPAGRERAQRLLWPEQNWNRPMLRQYAATMGKSFRDILTRIR